MSRQEAKKAKSQRNNLCDFLYTTVRPGVKNYFAKTCKTVPYNTCVPRARSS